jgi:arabinogalactan endo-1,4-beta-galactosidase
MSWRNLSYEELVEEVRTYTRESLEACEEAGVLPDIVQIGNEIVGGMIWPDGSTSNMKKFAELVNAGIDGVKDVSENIEIFHSFHIRCYPKQVAQ